VRTDNPALPGYELLVNPANADELRHALLKSGARPISADAVELVRIASGVPRYGQDIRERDLPQETSQTRALNFTKGCYVGQEIVERIRSRGNVHRAFTGFQFEGSLPPAGTKIQAEGKEVGEVTSAAWLPLGDGQLPAGLGYIRREAAAKELQAGEAAVRVVELPLKALFP
jgi:folate-binding protein YgfZ